MEKTRFTKAPPLRALKAVEDGRRSKDGCRENGVSAANHYKWKAEYVGMASFDINECRVKKVKSRFKTDELLPELLSRNDEGVRL